LDADTKKQIDSGRRLTAILNQEKNAPIPFERQVIVIYATINGFFDAFLAEKMGEIEKKFLAYMDREGKDVLESIKTEKTISEGVETSLKNAIQNFVANVN
jgi:F-type H+-transporting ATPase subunit alpha